jgi:hypothetical protein
MKTNELTGAALDWAVAKCEDFLKEQGGNLELFGTELKAHPSSLGVVFEPSTDWAQGGPIIDRLKGFQFKQWLESKPESCCEAHIHNYEGDWIAFGPTPLIAAMRCYVASKLGDEVDVPEELK